MRELRDWIRCHWKTDLLVKQDIVLGTNTEPLPNEVHVPPYAVTIDTGSPTRGFVESGQHRPVGVRWKWVTHISACVAELVQAGSHGNQLTGWWSCQLHCDLGEQ